MKGSNSKILQRQLKFQNAANSKENGQKTRIQKKIPETEKK
jgi:hypothetical protein